MGIFDGLGAGLGAAAQGYLTGQNKGEAERYRREQQALDREQKATLLKLRRKETDPNEKARQFAGQMALSIQGYLADPSKQADFSTPWGRKHQKRLQEQLGVWLGVRAGNINPRDADSYMLSWGLEPEDTLGERGEELPEDVAAQRGAVGRLPFLQQPVGRDAPSLGLQGVGRPTQEREPMLDQWSGGANIPLDAPEGPALPPQAGPPDISASLQPPAQPPTALERYHQIAGNPPKTEPIQGETPKQTEARRQAAMREWNQQVTMALQQAQADDLVRRGAADATRAEGKAKTEPRIDETVIRRNKVAAGLGTAQAQQIRQTLPIKVAQGKAGVKKTTVETAAIPRRLEQTDRGLTERERANRERERQGRARQASLDAYRNKLIAKADKALAWKTDNEEAKLLQKDVDNWRKIITARQRGVVADERQFDPAMIARAQQNMEKALTRLSELRRKEAAKPAAAPAPVRAAAPRSAPADGRPSRSALLASAKKLKMDKPTTAAFLKANGY